MDMTDKLHEECGVFGIWKKNGQDASLDIYNGLLSLQHRGQEAAGIAVCNTYGERGNICIHKDMGLVTEVFDEAMLNDLQGNIGVGHVRYSTTGDSTIRNAQPIAFQYLKGTLALVHNGNIVNASDIKSELLKDGSVFHATSDSEVIATLIAKIRAHTGSIEEAVREIIPKLQGGYALIIMSPRKIIAVRDPWGIKPLCLGKVEDGYVVASESCALTSVEAEFIRDIRPGEIVTLSKNGMASDTSMCTEKTSHAHCIFEYIYFARLDSSMDGVGIYDARFRGGMALAQAHPADADIVTGVPESGLTAAEGFAHASGLPFVRAFHKNSYIGRTFIKPTDKERHSAVHMKLGVIPGSVSGKRVVLIDDSIVRGTTISNLITMLRKAGATEVHVRISSPPFLHPCYYGTDVPDNSQLIANKYSIEEIRSRIGADSLAYMRLEDLSTMVEGAPICKACFDGTYPTGGTK
ncbi:MAG: amidophosphoribosyltransferase [Lachnospiraceae bacterium]|nr:amidophosphoribosyltransferase [Lachnospiraceae bacterium]